MRRFSEAYIFSPQCKCKYAYKFTCVECLCSAALPRNEKTACTCTHLRDATTLLLLSTISQFESNFGTLKSAVRATSVSLVYITSICNCIFRSDIYAVGLLYRSPRDPRKVNTYYILAVSEV